MTKPSNLTSIGPGMTIRFVRVNGEPVRKSELGIPSEWTTGGCEDVVDISISVAGLITKHLALPRECLSLIWSIPQEQLVIVTIVFEPLSNEVRENTQCTQLLPKQYVHNGATCLSGMLPALPRRRSRRYQGTQLCGMLPMLPLRQMPHHHEKWKSQMLSVHNGTRLFLPGRVPLQPHYSDAVADTRNLRVTGAMMYMPQRQPAVGGDAWPAQLLVALPCQPSRWRCCKTLAEPQRGEGPWSCWNQSDRAA